jgi:hypothetical protein
MAWPPNHWGCVSCRLMMRVRGVRWGLCYVADVIGISIVERYADVVVEEVLEVLDKVGVDEVAAICKVHFYII